MSKRRSQRADKAKKELFRLEKVQALKDLQVRSERIARARIEATRFQEEAHLTLATALIILKQDLNLSWAGLASDLNEVADSTTLYKLAQRKIYISLPKFRLLVLAVAKLAGENQVSIPLIPEWTDWKSQV